MKKLLILICLLWSTISYAEIESEGYDLFGMSMPMMCGLPAVVDKYIADKKFTAINVSFGKQGSDSEGEILFAIKYYINDNHQTLAVAESPNDPYKCIIFHSFDMIMNKNLLGPDGTDT